MFLHLPDIPDVPGTKIVTTQRTLLVSLLMLAVFILVFAGSIYRAEGLIMPQGVPLGGDFVAFWGAARAILDGLLMDIYRPDYFEIWLKENILEMERFGMTWHYPPTYIFFILPLSFLPYVPGYILWTGGTFALFLFTLKKTLNLRWPAILIILCLPVCYNAVITGQNGFITATLLTGAALLPDRRPLVAGLCAGLLAIKPQFAVLLPFAFIAASCWKAFAYAAISTTIIVLASVFAFGFESWIGFFNAVFGVLDGVKGAIYPLHKMPTVYAALANSGVPSTIAMPLQIMTALLAIAFVFYAWWRVKDTELRAGLLCACVFLCTPFAYFYEMTLLIPPTVILVRQAMKTRFLPFEEIGLVCLWILPMVTMSFPQVVCAQIWLATVLILLALLVRRALPDLLARSGKIQFSTAMTASPAHMGSGN